MRPAFCSIRRSFARPINVICDELRAIQLRFGYLPKAELEALSERTQNSALSAAQRRQLLPAFSSDPARQSRNSPLRRHELPSQRFLRTPRRTPAPLSSLRPEDVQVKDVSCLGRCDQAPRVAVNDEIHVHVNADKVEDLARQAMRGDHPHVEHPRENRVACASDPYGDDEKYGVLRRFVASKDWDGLLATLKKRN